MQPTKSATTESADTAPVKHEHEVKAHPRANEMVDPQQLRRPDRSRRLRLTLTILFGVITVALIAAAFTTAIGWMMVVAIAGFALYMVFIMLPILLASSAKITDDEKVARSKQRS